MHGLLGSLRFFRPEEFLPNVNVVSPDLFGYGDSLFKEDLTLQDQVDFVKQSIEKCVDKKCWLLGHSVGGAVVNILASQCPDLVEGIINVEGNFTINDAFWCESISHKELKNWEIEYEQIRGAPEKWLEESHISITPQRLEWAKSILAYQEAKTVQAVAKAVVRDTANQEYESIVSQVAESNIPTYLVAGEHSLNDWDIPENVRKTAVKLCVIKESGHMMMLEKPNEFCKLVEQIISGV